MHDLEAAVGTPPLRPHAYNDLSKLPVKPQPYPAQNINLKEGEDMRDKAMMESSMTSLETGGSDERKAASTPCHTTASCEADVIPMR